MLWAFPYGNYNLKVKSKQYENKTYMQIIITYLLDMNSLMKRKMYL